MGPVYCFRIDFYDEMADLVRPYILNFYVDGNQIEILDLRNKRVFLRKTTVHQLELKELYIGNTVYINGRQYKIVDIPDPDMKSKLEKQKTYAMIKPGFSQYLGQAIDRIERAGLEVANLRYGMMPRAVAEEFYQEHKGKTFYESLVGYMTSGPIVAMELHGNDAVTKWRQLIGPTNLDQAKQTAPNSLRALYARSTTENFAHGSDSVASANRELGIIFGRNSIPLSSSVDGVSLCVIKPHAIAEKHCGGIICDIQDAGFAITGAMMTRMEPAVAEEFLEVYRGVVSDYPEMVCEMSSGPVLALEVMAESDTVQRLRKLCGPRDPRIAQKILKDTLRAKYGTDLVKNAVHCTDLEEDAQLESEYFFTLLEL